MIRYLESVIIQSIDLDVDGSPYVEPAFLPPSIKGAETDHEFHSRLFTDSNTIACNKRLYSSNHNATCFKYSQNS